MLEYEFVHLLMHNSKGYNTNFIEMMVSEKEYFNLERHLFVTAFQPLYDEVQSLCNIELCTSILKSNIEMIDLYGDRGEIIIAHSLPSKWYVDFNIRKDLYNKLVWRSWGHDTVNAVHYPSFWGCIKNYKWILAGDYRLIFEDMKIRRHYKRSMRCASNFRAIGMGDTVVDRYLMENRLGIKNIYYYLPYGKKDDYDKLKKVVDNSSKKDEFYHILVGHSGFPEEKHASILKILKRFECEKLKIHFILSYGDEKYIEDTIKFINDNWSGEVDIVRDYMEFEDYMRYLSMMDAAILPGKNSYALGNIAILLFMGKKLFLNKHGIIAKGFASNGIQFESIETLKKGDFGLVTKSISNKNAEKLGNVLPWQEGISLWKRFFNDMKAWEE